MRFFSTKLGAKRATPPQSFFGAGAKALTGQRILSLRPPLYPFGVTTPSLEGAEAALRSAIALRCPGAQIVPACAQTYFAVLESVLMRAQRLSTQKAGQKSGFSSYFVYVYMYI